MVHVSEDMGFSPGREMIAHKPYSAHPGDAHLQIVLYRITKGSGKVEYVTWVNNIQDGPNGLYAGDYFDTFEAGLKSFNIRGGKDPK